MHIPLKPRVSEKQAAESFNGGICGTISDNFIKDNPMNVEECEAKLQMIDYSNGRLKNITVKVVADVDVMSGNVVELDESMLIGIDQDHGIEMA